MILYDVGREIWKEMILQQAKQLSGIAPPERHDRKY